MAAANPKSNIDIANNYMKKIKEKFKEKYHDYYTFDEGKQDESIYHFNVNTTIDNKTACNCILLIDHGEYSPYNLRSGPKPAIGIKVNSIHTLKGHTSKRLGIALLFYSICWLYINIPNTYEYIRLDDATNGKPLDPDNFYIKLGFVPEGHIALNNGKKLKNIKADEVKVTSMNYFINWMIQHQLDKLRVDKLGGRRKKIYTKYSKRTCSKSKRMKRTRKH